MMRDIVECLQGDPHSYTDSVPDDNADAAETTSEPHLEV